jgi:restriction system protein
VSLFCLRVCPLARISAEQNALRWQVIAAPDIGAAQVALTVSGIIIPERPVEEGVLIRATGNLWAEIVALLSADWSEAYKLTPRQWEELVAGAFEKEGYRVTLTPQSGDHGRDVIAVKHGIGCVKIIGSVKAYRPQNLVSYDDVRALLGVMSGERDVSKGIITTTSDFPPLIARDPFIASFMPMRLELINGTELQRVEYSIVQPRGPPTSSPSEDCIQS